MNLPITCRLPGRPWRRSRSGFPGRGFGRSYRQAYYIRRRFTVLDLASRIQKLEPALKQVFGPEGRWPIE